jgi:serine/threonine protein kinase HipA of HipAB toxin-antitoxin module
MPQSRCVHSFAELPRQSFYGLPGLLADSLPDRFGNALINAWLATQGRAPDSFNAVERLCYPGFSRRMAFNIVARNQDDHVKNIAFLMDKTGRWSLSPAFDATYSFDPDGVARAGWCNASGGVVLATRLDAEPRP